MDPTRLNAVLAALGGFHVILLHFPIGFLAAAACLELWGTLGRRRVLRRATSILLAVGATTAVAAASCGWLLAETGGYDDVLLERHRWLGVATACLALVVLWLRRRASLLAYRVTFAAWLLATAGAAHVGGMLTHGSTTPYAMLARALSGQNGDAPALVPPEVAGTTFVTAVEPILESHCVECHGPEKQKHGLRLDNREAALKGGESGKPAIVPGNAIASVLVEAVTLPPTNERAMPPEGKPRLTPEQVLTLIDWINHGAEWADATQRAAMGVRPASPEALEELRAAGFQVGPLAQGIPLVRVEVVPPDARLSALRSITGQIAWLDLSGRCLSPVRRARLAEMPHLSRLELQRSTVTDGDLRQLASLPHLAVLNLYGTAVGDAGLLHLRNVASLERVYLWNTRVTDAGIQGLREAIPSLRVESGT